MPKSRPITPGELAAIRKSVSEAYHRVALARMGLAERDKRGRFAAPPFQPTINQKTILRAYRWIEGRAIVDLNWDSVKGVFQEAIKSGDAPFFRRLAKVLLRPPKCFFAYLANQQTHRLELFLLDHWAEAKNGLPELFYLTPDALTKLCRQELGMRGLSTDLVKQTQQRLMLKAFKRQKRDATLRGGRWTFPPMDKRNDK